MIKNIFIALLVALLPQCIAAQNFLYKSKVDPVAKDGFYKIQLSPNISALANSDMGDLRMFDNSGKEIPFLYKKEAPFQSGIDFISYSVLSNTVTDEWQTLIIENASKNAVDRFIFEMKNAETDRVVRISGSNDKEQWYVVRDRFYFSMLGYGDNANVQALIDFPVSDYAYFKVEIKNRNKQPLNVIQVGYTKDVSKTPSYQRVDGITFQRIDSNDKKTYLHFRATPANRIDKLSFRISAPALFRRSAQLIFKEDKDTRNEEQSLKSSRRHTDYYRPDMDFELLSESDRSVATHDLMGDQKTGYFTVMISNFDNEPLAIDSITAWQLTGTLTAELKKDKSYFLYFGDSLLNTPNYDLRYFEKNIPDDIATIYTAEVQPKSTVLAEEYDPRNDKMMVWIGIGVIGLILVFLTVSMMKKMGDKSE